MKDFYSEHAVKGRRTYGCQFCRRPIERGTLHIAVAMGADGKVSEYRAHLDCHTAATGKPPPAHASESRAKSGST